MDDLSPSQAARRRKHRNHPLWLMISLFTLLLIEPIFDQFVFAGFLASVLMTVIAIASVASVGGNRRQAVLVGVLGLPVIALNWLTRMFDNGLLLDLLTSVWLCVFLLYLAAIMLTNMLHTTRVTGRMLYRAISAYLLIGLAWGSAYEFIMLLDPDAIVGLEGDSSLGHCIYYSFITLTTLGYGDHTPVAPWAKSLAVTEAIVGPLFLAILVARLAALYRGAEHADEDDD